jgi:hypothetical protein
MDDPTNQLQTLSSHGDALGVNWFSWLLGLVVILIGAISRVIWVRVDKTVTRDELVKIITQNKMDSDDKHRENTIRLERIEDRVNALPTVATTIRVVKQSPRRRKR